MLFFSTALKQRSLRGGQMKAPFVYLQSVDVFAFVSTRVAIVHKCYFLLLWLFVRLLF